MKFKPEKLISPEKLRSKAVEWKYQAAISEGVFSNYYDGDVDRTEGTWDSKNIRKLHDVSILEEVIPEIISRKKEGEKVKILDLGGGVGDFANQIRQKFGDRVKVFTTGLKKKTAKEFKKERFKESHRNPNGKVLNSLPIGLHPDDLKWRSILELSDYPEFDLIIDTFGEHRYSIPTSDSYRYFLVIDYLKSIAKKLNEKGQAYITPNWYIKEVIQQNDPNFIRNMRSELGIEITINSKKNTCKITKLSN